MLDGSFHTWYCGLAALAFRFLSSPSRCDGIFCFTHWMHQESGHISLSKIWDLVLNAALVLSMTCCQAPTAPILRFWIEDSQWSSLLTTKLIIWFLALSDYSSDRVKSIMWYSRRQLFDFGSWISYFYIHALSKKQSQTRCRWTYQASLLRSASVPGEWQTPQSPLGRRLQERGTFGAYRHCAVAPTIKCKLYRPHHPCLISG